MRFVTLLLPPLPFNGSNDVVDDDSVVTKSVFRRRSSWHARRHFSSSISAITTTTTSSLPSIFFNGWKQVLPSTMIIITIAIFYGLLLPTTNDYEYCDSSTTTRRRGVVFVVDAFRLNHGSHSIGSSRGMNRIHIQDDTTTFVPTLRRHSTPSYHLQPIRSHSSFTSSILQRYMVNFGPYGDFLNSRVNDNDENNDSGNDGLNNNNSKSNNKNQDTQPNPSPTTSKNHIQHQSQHQHHGGIDDNVVFLYGSDHMMDQFYYYYGCPTETTCSESQMNDSRTPSESTSNDNINSDDSSSSTTNNTPPPPPPLPRQWTPSWSSSFSSSPLLQTQSLDKMDADMAAGTYRILQIPTASLKPGGLRLFIVMYVLGAIPALMMNNSNNNPNKLLIWKVDRPSNDEYVIDLYFHDHSAILSIELIPAVPPVPKVNDDNDMSLSSSSITESTNDVTRVPNDPTYNTGTGSMIYIHRIGSSPSFMYRIHEATILQGLLQELLTCATDPIIPNVQDRLLTLTNTTIQQLHTICDTFPFG
jgi:hypothetical protein